MSSFARMVRDLRRFLRLRQKEFGERLGDFGQGGSVTQSTVSRWENGEDDPGFAAVDSLILLARSAGFDTRPYISEDGAVLRRQTPLVGYVGAGAEITPFPSQDPIEYLESPPGVSEGAVAVQVRGDSMAPSFRDGAILFYDAVLEPDRMIGREVVAHLQDGRKFIKLLTRGSRPNTFTLMSTNGPPILDVRLEGASPVVWIKPAL